MRKSFATSAACVLACLNASMSARSATFSPVRVMTYNVRYSAGDRGTENDWQVRRDALADLVERESPDVVGFQEVLPDQRQWLEARFPGYTFVGEGRNADRKSGEASPIAFRKERFEAAKCGTFWLSETPDVPGSRGWKAALPRICSYAVLKDKATGRTFAFANTHTDHRSQEAREKGMLLVIERMREFSGNAPVVFTGDHNCLEYESPAKSVAKLLRDAVYLSETPPMGAWRTFNFWSHKEKETSIVEALGKPVLERSVPGDKSDHKRIDYIYVSPGTRVLAYRTIPDTRPGTKLYPSDHFPSVADIVVPASVASPAANAGTFSAVSPDGKNEIRLETGDGGMKYSVWRGGKALVEPSEVSLALREHGRLDGGNASPVAKESRLGGTLATPIYKKSQVDLSANVTRVGFGDWAFVMCARNDGVAWRFETAFDGELTVEDEVAHFAFPESAQLCYSQVGGFQTGFEKVASYGKVADVKNGHSDIVLAPMTAVVPGAGVVGVTESNLLAYPGLNFRRTGDEGFMRAAFASAPDPAKVEVSRRMTNVKGRLPYLVKTEGRREFPWRVFVVADDPSGLVSSDIVYALAEPCRLKGDLSWIKPGLVQWDWWHGFNISDVPGLKTGCNYETYKAYIDFAAANGIPYIIMDEGWSEKLNLDKPRAEANPEGVIRYGQEKGVGVILWAAWAPLMKAEDRARIFGRYAAMGAKGFKIDFMNRDDAELERFLEATAADAAAHRLVVMYHGIHKPTGLCRTFPNVLNYEGVYGLEQGHGRGGQQRIPPNDCAIPYMRGLAGMMDYTPGAMHNRAFDAPEFRSVDKDEPRGCYGTRCHQLALFPLFEGPVQMLCDSPTMYRKNPECTAFLTKVPTVWDETRGVAGEIGKFAAIARRRGGDWWIGAITDWTARELELPTAFLGEGEWKVEAFEDAGDSDKDAERYVRREFTVKAGEPLKVSLAPGGGFAAKFTR